MKDNSYLPNCSDNDVFSFGSNTKPVMFRVSKFRDAVKQAFQKSSQVADALSQFLNSQGVEIIAVVISQGGAYISNLMWFTEGIDCEVLKLGAKDWQKGKVRIRVSLEFCPDEPETKETPAINQPEIGPTESPLDDIRRMMT